MCRPYKVFAEGLLFVRGHTYSSLTTVTPDPVFQVPQQRAKRDGKRQVTISLNTVAFLLLANYVLIPRSNSTRSVNQDRNNLPTTSITGPAHPCSHGIRGDNCF